MARSRAAGRVCYINPREMDDRGYARGLQVRQRLQTRIPTASALSDAYLNQPVGDMWTCGAESWPLSVTQMKKKLEAARHKFQRRLLGLHVGIRSEMKTSERKLVHGN